MTPTLPFPFCARPPNQDGQTNVEHPACSSAERSTGMYKALIPALLWFAGTCSANAEVWRVREGQCGEWRSWWTVRAGSKRSLDGLDRSRACRWLVHSGQWHQGAVQCSSIHCWREFFRHAPVGDGPILQLLRPDPAGSGKGGGVVRRSAYPAGLRLAFSRSADPSQPQHANSFNPSTGTRSGAGRSRGSARAGHE